MFKGSRSRRRQSVDSQQNRDLAIFIHALARAARASGDLLAAVAHLGALHRTTTRPVERQYARAGLETILAGPVPLKQLRQIYGRAAKGSLVAAISASSSIASAAW